MCTGVASRCGWLSTLRCIGACQRSCLGWPFYAASVCGPNGTNMASDGVPLPPWGTRGASRSSLERLDLLAGVYHLDAAVHALDG